MSRLSGDAIIPVPLRSCAIEPYDVTVTVTPTIDEDIPILLSHFAGKGGDFTLFDQVKAEPIAFVVKRLIAVE